LPFNSRLTPFVNLASLLPAQKRATFPEKGRGSPE
jgi:hypothetical protein